MLAWQLPASGSLDALELRDVPDPVPDAGQVLVRVRAAALNHADLEVLQGTRFARFMHARSYPLTPGFDFAGVVERVGDQVRGRVPGDEVFGFLPYSPTNDRGTLAQYVLAHPHELYRKPAGVGFTEAAAAATCGLTAVGIVRLAGRIEGRRVLVNGATGGVGSLLVQVARAHDAEVWGTARAENLAFLRRLGAAAALDYATTTPEELRRQFQLVADVADRWSYRRTERVLRTGGAYVALRPSLRYMRGKLASLLSSRSCHVMRVMHRDDDFEVLVRLLGARRIKVPLHASYSLEDAASALRLYRDESVRGKVAVVVSAY